MQEQQEHKWLTFFKSPAGIFTALTLIVAIVAIYVTIVNKENVSLTVDIEQTGFFISSENNESVEKKLKVLFNDVEVKKPYFIRMTLKNTGNVPIRQAMFMSDFILKTSNNVRILDVSLSSATTPALKEEFIGKITIHEDAIIFSPFLLNSSEYITLLLITDDETTLNYIFRIEGISRLSTTKQSSEAISGFKLIYGLVLIISSIIYIILFSKWMRKRHRRNTD